MIEFLGFIGFLLLLFSFGGCTMNACAPSFTAPPTWKLPEKGVEIYKYESTSRVGKVRVKGTDYYVWGDNVATGPVFVPVPKEK